MTSLMTSEESRSQLRTRKRTKGLLWGLMLISAVFLGAVLLSHVDGPERSRVMGRYRRQAENSNIALNRTSENGYPPLVPADENSDNDSQPIYPPDIFNLEARRKGAVVLHVIGMLYMFVALAIVCDEFFVPALEIIIRRLEISDDVAGATFMAAGGSAPELATSVIGLFLAKSNVGIGTIVGSAVFNILFVIGMCSLFSREILQLTWWPLFRDCMFYVISLVALIIAFSDSLIQYYESVILIGIYLFYVIFMKFNGPIESWVKSKLPFVTSSNREKEKVPRSVKAIVEAISTPDQANQAKKSTFSYGIVQLMMHSLDPATDEDTAEKSSRLYAIARMKLVSPRMAKDLTKTEHQMSTNLDSRTDCEERSVAGKDTTIVYENEGTKVVTHPHVCKGDHTSPCTSQNGDTSPVVEDASKKKTNDTFIVQSRPNSVANECVAVNGKPPRTPDVVSCQDLPEQQSETLDLSWPRTWPKRIVYFVLAPIMFLLWLTLPDVRDPKKEGRFMITFFLSISWIAIFSYFMVWMAHQVGETIGLSEAEMGLTFLAAGTSVPDLITSVIVARKGLGDMAVSSSVGSNIFDVTVGLPLPWLVGSIIELGSPIPVVSKGLFCSIILLFSMLIFVIISIVACRWKMNRKLGISMLIFYVFFLVMSLLLESGTIPCLGSR